MPGIESAVIAAISYVGSSAAAVATLSASAAQIATVAAVGIGAGVGSMAVAKSLTPEIGSQGAAVRWEANPDAPLRFAFGRVGIKGSIFDAAVYGPDRMYVSFACTVSAAGPIRSFQAFRAGDYYMSFNGAGMATNEPYAGEMWLSTRLGAQPDTALSLPSGLKNGAAFPGWNSTRKMSGSAGYLVTLGENSKRSAYDGKIPAFVATIEGLFCYDPRLDSTYPGGSGSCRLNNPATWVWTRNPILFALKWTLGLWEGPTGKGAPQVDYQVGGIGAKVEGIHLASFVTAANVSDANGWTSAAYPSTDDDKAQVLDGFMKAGGAMYAEIAGKIACIHRAAPRSTVFTVTARDTAGPVEIDTASSKLNRINTIRPRYWAEDQEWEMTALPEVTSSVWQIEDGQGVAVKRTRGADFTFVDQPKQARELAGLEIGHSREGIRGRVPLRPYMDPEPGNCFIFDEPDFALSNVKCFITQVDDDTENDTVIVTFESETDGNYPFAYGQTGSPPPPQELDPTDPREVNPPNPLDWEVVVRPPAPTGGQVPGFDLTGVVSNSTATRVLVEVGPSEDGPWTPAYDAAPSTARIQITVDPNTTYFVAVSYFRATNQSARSVYGPYTTGPLIADDTATLGGTSAEEFLRYFRELPRVIGDTDQAAEVLIREALDRHEQVVAEERARAAAVLAEATARVAAINAEQGARVAGLLAEAAARGTAIAGVSSSVTTVAANLAAEITTRTEQYAATSTSVALVAGQVTTVAGNLFAETATRTSQISAVNTSIAGVVSSVSTVATDLAAQTTSTTTQFSTVNGTLASHSSAITTNATAISAEVTTRTTQIANVNTSIAGVVSSVSTVASDLAAQTVSTTNQFSSVNGTLAGHTTSITTNATAISAETSTRTSQISSVNATIAAVSTDVTTVATALSAETTTRTSQIASVTGSVASVVADVATVATNLAAETTARLALAASTSSGLAGVNSTLTALSNADTVLASSVNTVQTTANGAYSAAFFAIEALNGNQAYIAFGAEVGGRITGARFNGVDRAIDFLGDVFSVTPGSGGGIKFDGPNKLFKIFDGSSKTVLKAGGSIRMWSGPSSVADGAETEDNGVLAIGPGVVGGGRFNGVTLSGPFGAETPSGIGTALTGSFATVGQGERVTVNGAFFFEVSAQALPEGTPDSEGFRVWSVDLQIVSTAWAGGDAEVVWSDSFGGSWGPGAAPEWVYYLSRINLDAPGLGTRSGRRRLSLQARQTPGSPTTSAALKDGYFRGFYAA